jgi:pyridoxamine 5'-phosphate oxidase
MTMPSEPPTDLADGAARCWAELQAGAADRRHPFHLGVLSTLGRGGTPQSRTVVLRDADGDRGLLFCHSDARSPKVAEIDANPAVAWVFYDPARRVQLRIAGTARVHRAAAGDPLAIERWERSSRSSRRCYLAPRPPGAACDGPSPNLPPELLGRTPEGDEDAPGLVNFAVLATAAVEIDRLELHAHGHRRARFRLGAAGRAEWIEP